MVDRAPHPLAVPDDGDVTHRLAPRADAIAEVLPSRRPWSWLVAALLFALLLGLLGSPWAERQLRGQLPLALADETAAQRDSRVDALIARVEQLEARPSPPGAVPARPMAADAAALETRLAALEAGAVAFQSSDAANAAQLQQLAEALSRTEAGVEAGDAQLRDLFLLGVTRRLFEAGRPLAPVQGALSERFRTRDGAAIEALLAWAAAPQTHATLSARLPDLALVAPAAPGAGWWERLKAQLAGLVTVREPGAAPTRTRDEAVALAREALLANDVRLAIATMRAAGSTPAIAAWMADAERMVAAEEALSRLEERALEGAVPALATGTKSAGRSEPPVNAQAGGGRAAPLQAP